MLVDFFVFVDDEIAKDQMYFQNAFEGKLLADDWYYSTEDLMA